jgi:D-3-phosphoglycerate dehydrogenase
LVVVEDRDLHLPRLTNSCSLRSNAGRCIAILDDYQDAVRNLECFSLLDGHDVTVFNEPFRTADALAEFDALVLIRERTVVTAELLAQLPRLRQISQTGRVGRNIDVQACTARGIAITEGVGSPIAPAEPLEPRRTPAAVQRGSFGWLAPAVRASVDALS